MKALQPHFSDRELKHLYLYKLRKRLKQFKKTGNPVLAVEVILLANLLNRAWPTIIANLHNEWFQRWHDLQGTVSLDEIIGLRLSRGKTPPYKVLLIAARNEKLFEKIAILKALGCTTVRAFEVVCRGFECVKVWNKSMWSLKTIDADTLGREYSRWPDRKRAEKIFRGFVSRRTPDEIRKFLGQFPYDALPVKLKLLVRPPTHSFEQRKHNRLGRIPR